MVGKLGQPRGVAARTASMAGVSSEYADLFTRKKPVPKAAPAADLQPELDAARARIAELEASRDGWRSLAALWKACAKKRVSKARLLDVLGQLQGAEGEVEIRRGEIAVLRAERTGRRRVHRSRGSARVRRLRYLRERLAMALLMVDRLRAKAGERTHRRLVGGVEDLKDRAATLPALGGSPYSSQVHSLPIGGDN